MGCGAPRLRAAGPGGASHTIPRTQLAVLSGLCGSKAECSRLIKGGGLYLNNVRVTSRAAMVTRSDLMLNGTRVVLRSGKRRQVVVIV